MIIQKIINFTYKGHAIRLLLSRLRIYPTISDRKYVLHISLPQSQDHVPASIPISIQMKLIPYQLTLSHQRQVQISVHELYFWWLKIMLKMNIQSIQLCKYDQNIVIWWRLEHKLNTCCLQAWDKISSKWIMPVKGQCSL